jgi:hypothetical protein
MGDQWTHDQAIRHVRDMIGATEARRVLREVRPNGGLARKLRVVAYFTQLIHHRQGTW